MTRVVHINTFDKRGGASIAAYRLHRALISAGIDSYMLVKEKSVQDTNIIEAMVDNINVFENDIKCGQDIFVNYLRKNRTPVSNTLFSFTWPGYDISSSEIIQTADVIILHWVTFFQSVETIGKLLKLGKPVIWTIHDMWPFTGGCHYTAGCKGYETACSNCPQLKNDPHSISQHLLDSKTKSWDLTNLIIVTPSKWMGGVIRKSMLFRNADVHVIPYSLDLSLFTPVDKKIAKESLEMDGGVITIYFGAHIGKEKRKGFQILVEVLDHCSRNPSFRKLINQNRLKLILSGTLDNRLIDLGMPYKHFGLIENEDDIVTMYQAADIVVLPSLEDNLPNIVLESMSCATPVIAFDIGGLPDMVRNNKTGILIQPFDTDSFGEAIIDLVMDPVRRQKYGENGRKFMEENFNPGIQAKRYHEVIKEKFIDEPFGRKQHSVPVKCIANLSLERNEKLLPLFKAFCEENQFDQA